MEGCARCGCDGWAQGRWNVELDKSAILVCGLSEVGEVCFGRLSFAEKLGQSLRFGILQVEVSVIFYSVGRLLLCSFFGLVRGSLKQ